MPIEHREPTKATVKELYANAFRCAYPGCCRPLYTLDPETGDRILNSRVSHICARRENGPRWDSVQSEDENRSIKNLLLLCLQHASEIDQQNRVDKFPPEQLRQWKQQQLKDFDSLGCQGWSLTSEMAEKVIDASHAKSITIAESVLNLGGEGGKSPGAGGGGGGALGQNSQGGKGGQGGEIRSEGISRSDDIIAEFSQPFSDLPFGSGGGGAGTFGENAVGGNGGDGGESVITFISPEDLENLNASGFKRCEISIGEGGKGYPGEQGSDGQETLINFVADDGRLLRSIRAKGGSGGKPGSVLPVGSREVTLEDLKKGFSIPSMLLADAFHIKNGLLYVLGAGCEHWVSTSLPQNTSWPIACILSFGQISISSLLVMFIVLENPAGQEILRNQFVISNDPLRTVANTLFLQNLQFRADILGVWKLKILSGQFELARLAVEIRLVNP